MVSGVLESGLEFGFIIGVLVEEGAAGVVVGTVVIGVVMSLWVVDIGEVNCISLSKLSCSLMCSPPKPFFVKLDATALEIQSSGESQLLSVYTTY